MKGKTFDFSAIGGSLDEQFRKRVSSLKDSSDPKDSNNPKDSNDPQDLNKIRVMGTKRGLGGENSKQAQAIVLTDEDLNFIDTEHLYLTTDAVDAGLGLLDRRLNEESDLNVTVYTTQTCRLIFYGHEEFIKPGNFITIIPRNFGIGEEELRMNALRIGQKLHEPGSHFSLVSNLNCRQGEVNVYETFAPYRDQQALLTQNGQKLIKSLYNSKNNPLLVNAINVELQDESECGAIAVALAVSLCFHAPSEEAIHRKFLDVRKNLLECMKQNNLNYFRMAPQEDVPEHSKILFSIEI